MYDTTFKTPGTAYALDTAPRLSAGRQAHRLISAAFDTLAAWHERMRQRRRLGELDDRLLKDIGLTRADVAIETSKPFWQN